MDKGCWNEQRRYRQRAGGGAQQQQLGTGEMWRESWHRGSGSWLLHRQAHPPGSQLASCCVAAASDTPVAEGLSRAPSPARGE